MGLSGAWQFRGSGHWQNRLEATEAIVEIDLAVGSIVAVLTRFRSLHLL